jgi:hypothetical protein
LALLTYLLGPLSILLTPRGRRNRSAVVVALLAPAAALVLILGRFGGVVGEDRQGSVWEWWGLLAFAAIGGASVWSLAVRQLGIEGIPPLKRLPHWLRRGWFISVLGLVAPGSGLLLRGHAVRASLVLWLTWLPVAALVVLANAGGLWRHHQASGWLASSGPALETTFIMAAALVVFGIFGHIAQALEGLRQFTVEPSLKTRVKGDYYALAVIAAVSALVVVASPVQMAQQLDAGGDILRQEGLQTIPLALTLAAGRLDPGTSEYTLQAIDLYAELGRPDEAAALGEQLDRNLGSYLVLKQRESEARGASASALANATVRRPRAPVEVPADFMIGTMAKTPVAAKPVVVPDSAATDPPAAIVGPDSLDAPGPAAAPESIPPADEPAPAVSLRLEPQ